MTDPTPQEKARDAIYSQIADHAAAQTPMKAGGIEGLEKLADAYSKVAYGPQGGGWGARGGQTGFGR